MKACHDAGMDITSRVKRLPKDLNRITSHGIDKKYPTYLKKL